MAKRVAEVIYRLKDLFSGNVERIAQGYRRLGDSAQIAGRRTSRAFDGAAAPLARLSASLSKARGLMAGLGSAAVATQAFKNFVDQADEVGKIAEKLGVTSEELSALGYAAERANVPFQSMATSMQRLIRRSSEAAKNTGAAGKALRELGIDAKAFVALSLEDKMARLADAFGSIDNQADRVRLAFALFDSEGVDMVRVLQEGGSAMRALTAEARELGKTFDNETTAAAANFNDSLTKLSATWDGAMNSLLTGPLEAANHATEVFGISADKVANLRAELKNLESVQGGGFNPFGFVTALAEFTGLSDIEGDIARVRGELEAIENARSRQVESDAEAAASAAKLKAELAEQASVYASISERAESALDARKAAFDKETAELRRAKVEQLTIEQEFQRLVDEIAKPEDQDVSAIDVSLKQKQAAAAAEAGDTEKAIKLAREGGEMLEALKKKGTETGGTLGFLAEELQRVAVAASQSQVAGEQEDVRLAGGALKTMEAQVSQMKATAEAAGAEAGTAYARAMQEAMGRFNLDPPKVNQSAPRIRRNGDSFSDGTDFTEPGLRREIEKRGGK